MDKSDKMTIATGLAMIVLSAITLSAAFSGYLPFIAPWMETLGILF